MTERHYTKRSTLQREIKRNFHVQAAPKSRQVSSVQGAKQVSSRLDSSLHPLGLAQPRPSQGERASVQQSAAAHEVNRAGGHRVVKVTPVLRLLGVGAQVLDVLAAASTIKPVTKASQECEDQDGEDGSRSEEKEVVKVQSTREVGVGVGGGLSLDILHLLQSGLGGIKHLVGRVEVREVLQAGRRFEVGVVHQVVVRHKGLSELLLEQGVSLQEPLIRAKGATPT